MPLKKRIACFVFLFIFAMSFGIISVSAQNDCSIRVLLEDKEKKPIHQLNVSICKIADLGNDGYQPSESFAKSGISVSGIINNPSGDYAKGLLDYIKENSIEGISVSSVNGLAEFKDLEMGIWLVYCIEGQAHSFKPFFVFLPQKLNGQLCFDVTSAPKTDINTPNNKSIYIIKKWEDKSAESLRPESITVDLLLKGEVLETVVLNKQNGWAYTFKNLPQEEGYSVFEHYLANYTVKYNGDSENGFIITNVYNGEKLPQTGQLWWPVVIFGILGVTLVIWGIIEIKGKKNEKQK